MRVKVQVKVLAIGVLAAMLVSACGSKPPTQSQGSSAPAAQAPAAPAPAAPAPQAPPKTQIPATPDKVTIGYDAVSITGAPMQFTAEKGIFKKYGLDATLVYFDGGTKMTQGMLSGDVDIAQNGYSPVINAATQGAKLVFIGGISNTMPFQLVVKSTINSAADLKGKKIAISRSGSSTDTAADLAVESLKLKVEDVVKLQLGGDPQRVAALKSGQVDGIMTQHPQTGLLVREGYKILVDVTEIGGKYPNTSFVVQKEFLAKKPEVAKRFLMAMTEGLQRYRTEKDDAIKATAKFLKVDDPKSLEDTWSFYTTKVFPVPPRATMEGIANLLSLEKEAKVKLTPQDLVDNTLFEALEKEGFIKEITGK